MVIKVRNWEKFQHYKKGRGTPPWIKLYRDLLNDKEWFSLDPAAAKFLISVWILAAESDGYLPDSETIAFRLRLASKDVAKYLSLCNHWLIEDASKMLANCYQNATPETDTETETEEESIVVSKQTTICPHQEIVAAYHEALPMCPSIREWTPKRQRMLATRWKENNKRQTVDWWRRFFGYVAKSPFLTGKVQTNGRKPFVADLEWLIESSNMVKVIEGKYHAEEQ